MNKLKKKTALILGCASAGAVCLLGGSFAFLHTQDTGNKVSTQIGTVSMGNLAVEISNKSETTSDELNDIKIDENGNLTNLNPGDIVPIDFTVTNSGSKSVIEKSYVYLIFDNNQATGTPTDKVYGDYSNFIDMVSVLNDKGNAVEVTTGTYKLGDNASFKAIRFEVPENGTILNGFGPNAEKEQDVTSNSATHTFKVKFGIDANVHTQNQSMKVKIYTQSIQYRNTEDSDLTALMDDSAVFTPDSGQ